MMDNIKLEELKKSELVKSLVDNYRQKEKEKVQKQINELINEKDKDFKPYPFWRELFLGPSKINNYYENKRRYQYERNIYFDSISLKEKIHPILLKALAFNRKHIDHQDFTIIGDKREKDPITGKVLENEKVIFDVTHDGKFDYQIVSEAIETHQYPFAGDPETLYRSVDGLVLNFNGMVPCNLDSFLDRIISREIFQSEKTKEINGLIYSEGIWNITANRLSLPLFPSIVYNAQITNRNIIPIAVEQYGKHFGINIGKEIVIDDLETVIERYISNLSDEDKIKKINEIDVGKINKAYVEEKLIELTDAKATLKLEIFEWMYPENKLAKRKDLGSFKEEDLKYKVQKLNEWAKVVNKLSFIDKIPVINLIKYIPGLGKLKPYYTLDKIKEKTRKLPNVIDPEEAFDFLVKPQEEKEEITKYKEIECNEKTLFLFKDIDISLPDEIRENMQKKYQDYLKEENIKRKEKLKELREKLLIKYENIDDYNLINKYRTKDKPFDKFFKYVNKQRLLNSIKKYNESEKSENNCKK